jgi:hypothetical protein
VSALQGDAEEQNMELKTQNDIKESKLIRESIDVEELLVTQCPPNASDAQILQRIRAGVAAARRTHRYDLAMVADTDVVSCQFAALPKKRGQAARQPPRGTARFVVVRGKPLKDFLCNHADLPFPSQNWTPAASWQPPQMVALEFRPSGRKKSEARDEATETKLDVSKIQIVDCVEHPDDPDKPMQGKVLWEADVQSVRAYTLSQWSVLQFVTATHEVIVGKHVNCTVCSE